MSACFKLKSGESASEAIRRTYEKDPNIPRQEMADFYGVSISTVHSALARREKTRKSSKSSDSSDLLVEKIQQGKKKGSLIRIIFVSTPDLTIDEALTKWKSLGLGEDINRQDCFNALYQIKSKYDITSLLPLVNGKPDVQSYLTCYLKRRIAATAKQVSLALESDGMDVDTAMVESVRKKLLETNDFNKYNDSPDPNQYEGARAGGMRKRMSRQSKPKNNSSNRSTLLEIENGIDELIQLAQTTNDQTIIDIMKNCRRHIGTRLVEN